MIEPSLLGTGQNAMAKELAKIATAQVVEAKPGSLEGTGLKGALFVPGPRRAVKPEPGLAEGFMRGITDYIRDSKVEPDPRYVVTEGPAMQDPPRDVLSSQIPFAYRLRRSLEQLGAVIELDETLSQHGVSVSAGAVYTQLHVNLDCPEDLATEVFRRFGPHITFGTLTMPRGLEYVSWSRSGQVWVRYVIDYHVGSDTRIQRWDVLVRKT